MGADPLTGEAGSSVVLDTHAWLWWIERPSELGAEAAAAVEGADSVGISAISCWEVALLEAKGRIAIAGGAARWIRRALSLPGVISLPIDPQIAVEAALLDRDFPADPADRLIYATARSRGARLLTRDRRMREFDPRGTLW